MRKAIISFPMFGENFAIDPPYCIMLGNFAIYFYGIIIACGLLLAIWYTSRNCRRFDIEMDAVYDYLIWGVIAAVICARLYYCFTFVDENGVHTYLQSPASFVRIRDGGLAIYGGVIGAVLAVVVRSRMRHESVWPIMDVMGPGLLIGQLVGRWGNFFNREAFGYETDIFCRMGLTLNGSTIYVHPTFFYESLWNFIGFLILHFHSKKHRKYQGQYFFFYLIWYGIGRAMIEGLRSDSLWLIPDVIRISQLLAAVTAVLALIVHIINLRRLAAGRAPLLGRVLSEGNDADADAQTEPGDEAAPDGSESAREEVPAPQFPEESIADTPAEDAPEVGDDNTAKTDNNL